MDWFLTRMDGVDPGGSGGGTCVMAKSKSNRKTDTAILAVAGLRVERGEMWILDGVDWRVERGQHWVILGANGCGKTSLLKTLLGYLTPSAGEIEVLGERYGDCDWRELRTKIGLVSSALQASVPANEPALATVVSGRTAQLDLWATPTRAEAAAARRQLAFFRWIGFQSVFHHRRPITTRPPLPIESKRNANAS